MTCVTCHDPHRPEQPKGSVAFYRQKCLDCHAGHPCKVTEAERRKQQPADNCAACHMPRGDTDIPHIAFTHHRIGRHKAQPPVASDRVPDLVLTDDNPQLTSLERQRNLGLAYVEVYRNPVNAKYAQVFASRARELLEAAYSAGLREGETAAALADLYWKAGDYFRAAVYARQALDAPDTRPTPRATALLLLADCERRDHNFETAIGLLEESTRVRRSSDDWRLLGVSRLDLNDPRRALPALLRSLEIRPYRHTTHLGLAEAYRRLGDAGRERDHLDKATWLRDHRQD
jgi:tetratricopeptide (TPR) repeat protein